jgi:hypothetical protein
MSIPFFRHDLQLYPCIFLLQGVYYFYTEYGCVFTPVFVKFVKKEAKRFPNCLRLPRGIPADLRSPL